jgi:hypothetical protein
MKNELNNQDPNPRRAGGTETVSSFGGSLHGFYRGTVVSRDDPDKQGRVKIACPQIYGDIPVDELPWTYPVNHSWKTSSEDQPQGGSVGVPPLGSPVLIGFEGGDHRYPLMFGGCFGKPGFTDTVPANTFGANENSPDNYSFTSPRGTSLLCDERVGKEKVMMGNKEGNYFSMSKAGLTEAKSQDALSFKGENLITSQSNKQIQHKAPQILIYSAGSGVIVIEGAEQVNINSGGTVNVQAGTINLNCGGSKTAKDNLKEISTEPAFDTH